MRRTTVTIGHVIGAAFGMAFVIANSSPMPQAFRVVLIALAVAGFVLTVLTFGQGHRHSSRHEVEGERFGRAYLLIVVVEVVTLFGGLVVLNRLQPSAVVGWIALVVGVHFFWLARQWPSGSQEINTIAVALTVLGGLGILIAFTADSTDTVALVSGIGSGIVLLVSSTKAALTNRV